jgi:methylphosphotriester-DNA--protein-cysteine methyltransferase
MIAHSDLSQGQLMGMIKRREITYGGSVTMKTYGLLRCKAGKRGLKKNRVFFAHETEALAAGFRPCGCCQWTKYKRWKAAQNGENP